MMTYGVGTIGLGVVGRTTAAAMEAHSRFRVVGAYDPALISQPKVSAFASVETLVRDPAQDCIGIWSNEGAEGAAKFLSVAAFEPSN